VRKRGRGVYVWGRVRPGTGTRYVQLQRRGGGGYVNDGNAIATNSAGYFKVKRKRGTYRYQALNGRGGPVVGTSRTAKPLR
jgi:hypothetical protein